MRCERCPMFSGDDLLLVVEGQPTRHWIRCPHERWTPTTWAEILALAATVPWATWARA